MTKSSVLINVGTIEYKTLVGSNHVVRDLLVLIASRFSYCIIVRHQVEVDDEEAAITSIEETDPVPACLLDFVLWPDVSIDHKVITCMNEVGER